MISDRLQCLRVRVIFIIVFLFGFISHWDAINHWFVATDSIPLIESNRIYSLSDIIETITSPLMHSTSFTKTAMFWRPITELTYGFEHVVWGINPTGYHITNNILHGFAAVLVASVAWKLTNRVRATAISGTLFAIHPISIEVVPAIARRADILLTIFLCATIISYVRLIKSNKTGLWVAFPSIFFILSLGSKETALVIPGLLVISELFQLEPDFADLSPRNAVYRLFPIGGVAIVYLIIRFIVLGGLGGYQASPPSLISRLLIPLRMMDSLFLPEAIILSQIPFSRLVILLLYVGFGVLILGWLWINRSSLPRFIWPSLTLCIIWVALPTVLYVISGSFSMRSAYVCVAGLVFGLGLLLDFALSNTTINRNISSNCISIVFLTVLGFIILPMLVWSPVLGSAPGWDIVSETNENTLTELENEIDPNVSSSEIGMRGVRTKTQLSKSTGYPLTTPHIKAYTVESWLELQHPNGGTWNVTVEFDDRNVSSSVSVTCETNRATTNDTTCIVMYD